jgi:hypothetical protein
VTFDGPPFPGNHDTELTNLLQRWLPIAIPPERAALVGSWSRQLRRQYENPSQLGSGCGPYVDVLDVRWRGTIDCSVPVVGVAFLQTADEVYWVKSAPAALAQSVEICVSGYANYTPGAATLSCGLGGSLLPGVPVQASGNLQDCCRMGSGETTTGVPYQVCETESVRFIIVLVPQPLAKPGRSRLWRLRPQAALQLPIGLRKLFTYGRCGSWPRSEFNAGPGEGAG